MIQKLTMRSVVDIFNNYLKLNSATGFKFEFYNKCIHLMIEMDSCGWRSFSNVFSINKLFISEEKNTFLSMKEHITILLKKRHNLMEKCRLFENLSYMYYRGYSCWLFENINQQGVDFLELFIESSCLEEFLIKLQTIG